MKPTDFKVKGITDRRKAGLALDAAMRFNVEYPKRFGPEDGVMYVSNGEAFYCYRTARLVVVKPGW